jgi:hydrogenase maturation protease
MTSRTLVLGLGNELLSDDGVGIKAARALREELQLQVDVIECSESGLSLLDYLEGYERVLLLDAILTGRHPPGTVLEFCTQDFSDTFILSPHSAGIPELLQLAQRLGIHFPKKLYILAIEVENLFELGGKLTPAVEDALPEFISKGKELIGRMECDIAH